VFSQNRRNVETFLRLCLFWLCVDSCLHTVIVCQSLLYVTCTAWADCWSVYKLLCSQPSISDSVYQRWRTVIVQVHSDADHWGACQELRTVVWWKTHLCMDGCVSLQILCCS